MTEPDEHKPKPRQQVPLFLLQGSPLTAGGKARLMSARKVEPNRAKPREVSGPESRGYTEQAHRAVISAGECLDEVDWKTHVGDRSDTTEIQRRKFEEAQREQARRLMDFEERLTTAHAEACNRCIDVSSEVRLLRQMQTSGKAVRHLEQRLGAMERKVWKPAA